jgi:hypothetical protein
MRRGKGSAEKSRGTKVLEAIVLPRLDDLGYRGSDRLDLGVRFLDDEAVTAVAKAEGKPRIVVDIIETLPKDTSFETEARTRALIAYQVGTAYNDNYPTHAWVTDGSAHLFYDYEKEAPVLVLPEAKRARQKIARERQEEARARAALTRSLEPFYRAMGQLRELLHARGRFGGRNESLDELVKLLMVKMHEEQHGTNRLCVEKLEELGERECGGRANIAKALHRLFSEVIGVPTYRNSDGTSIFGETPSLCIPTTENGFARDVVRILEAVELLHLDEDNGGRSLELRYDILNEAFGNFIRDNFVNEKELAQYLTPIECVNCMTDLAFADIERDPDDRHRILSVTWENPYVILDPTCGVGSFLIASLRRVRQMVRAADLPSSRQQEIFDIFRDHCVYGQDKVDRMVSYAKLNMILFGDGHANIYQGNSIVDEPGRTDKLKQLEGQVSLILTNPPFGGEFSGEDIGPYEFGHVGEDFSKPLVKGPVDSEILLLERYIRLLRPGGRMVVVVPDGLLTNQGRQARMRQWLRDRAVLKAVISFPTVTFEQAGTATKTSALYMQKQSQGNTLSQGPVFMAVCEDTGFVIKTERGQKVRYSMGSNQLLELVELYGTRQPAEALS